jgi:hypothetical protein
MSPKIKPRRCKAGRVPDTRQPELFVEHAAGAESVNGLKSAPDEPEFLEGKPDEIFIGNQPLRQYLKANGQYLSVSVWEILKDQDYSVFDSKYSSRGRRALHPRIILGLTVYGMLEKKWSLRELETLAIRDVGAWWICEGYQPDHSTIGNFINRHIDVLSEEFFISLTRSLTKKLRLKPSDVGIDGTIIEAASSYRTALTEEAAKLRAEEMKKKSSQNLEDESLLKQSEEAEQAAQIAAARVENQKQKGRRHTGTKVSATEPEAALQKQKDSNKRLSWKPSAMTHESGMIIGQYMDATSETAAVKPLLKQHQDVFDAPPATTLIDAGYNCFQVLQLFVDLDLDVLCPSGQNPKINDGKKCAKKGKFNKGEFHFDKKLNVFICPAGKHLVCEKSGTESTGGPYRLYRCKHGESCPLKDQCTSAKNGRSVKRYDGDEFKEAMIEVLKHPLARQKYAKRMPIAERPFAEMKHRQNFRRFHRRGKAGARVEFALHSIAFNLKLVCGRLFLQYFWLYRLESGIISPIVAAIIIAKEFR